VPIEEYEAMKASYEEAKASLALQQMDHDAEALIHLRARPSLDAFGSNTSSAERTLGNISELRELSSTAFDIWSMQFDALNNTIPNCNDPDVRKKRATWILMKTNYMIKRKLLGLSEIQRQDPDALMEYIRKLAKPCEREEKYNLLQKAMQLVQGREEDNIQLVNRVNVLKTQCDSMDLKLSDLVWMFLLQRALKDHMHRSLASTMELQTFEEFCAKIVKLQPRNLHGAVHGTFQHSQGNVRHRQSHPKHSYRRVFIADGADVEEADAFDDFDDEQFSDENDEDEVAQFMSRGRGRGRMSNRSRGCGRGRPGRHFSSGGGRSVPPSSGGGSSAVSASPSGGRGGRSAPPSFGGSRGAGGQHRASMHRSTRTCWTCGNFGHISRSCPNAAHWQEGEVEAVSDREDDPQW